MMTHVREAVKKVFFNWPFIYFVPNIRYNLFYFNDFTILVNYVVGWQSRSFYRFVVIFGQKYGSFNPKKSRGVRPKWPDH